MQNVDLNNRPQRTGECPILLIIDLKCTIFTVYENYTGHVFNQHIKSRVLVSMILTDFIVNSLLVRGLNVVLGYGIKQVFIQTVMS